MHPSIFLFHFSLYVCDPLGLLVLLAHLSNSVVGGMVIVVIHVGGLSSGVLGVHDL